MQDFRLDAFDMAILSALQEDGAMTNAALGDVVHLSASQVSRRRSALETAGYIKGYAARLDGARLGIGLHAVVRVNLRDHGAGRDDGFARFVQAQPEVRAAHSVSGSADYVLIVKVRDLDAFAAFIHNDLLPHPQVAHVRSDIVMRTLKDIEGVDLSALR